MFFQSIYSLTHLKTLSYSTSHLDKSLVFEMFSNQNFYDSDIHSITLMDAGTIELSIAIDPS